MAPRDGRRCKFFFDANGFSASTDLIRQARQGAEDIYAAFIVFFWCLMNFESCVALSSAICATFFFNFYDFGEQYFAAKLSWTFAALAVVFPLTHEIKQAFNRRETALASFAEVKAHLVTIYLAHANWAWGKNGEGRKHIPAGHVDQVARDMEELAHMLCAYLTLPMVTRARNLFTNEGKTERSAQIPVQQYFFGQLYVGMRKLSLKNEVMKKAGMPAVEASRINQYHQKVLHGLETLHNIKEYRTPQGTRSFARVFIHLMPWLYGPYFVWVAHTLSKERHAMAAFLFSLVLSISTEIAMVGLYNVQRALQDPFDGQGFDDIHTETMCNEICNAIKVSGNDVVIPLHLVLDFKGPRLHEDAPMCVP